jgi:hypothetical protein
MHQVARRGGAVIDRLTMSESSLPGGAALVSQTPRLLSAVLS